MVQRVDIHAENPQHRLIVKAAQVLERGGVIVYPTDSTYALGCALGDMYALDSIRQIRRVEAGHEFTIVCRDLSAIATYARVDNAAYRLLKSLTPGPYTFILPATREAPRRLQDPKRKSIGLRVPANRIAQALLAETGEPILSSTLQLPDESLPLTDPDEIEERVGNRVELFVNGGAGGIEPTTILDLTGNGIGVVRRGKGALDGFDG